MKVAMKHQRKRGTALLYLIGAMAVLMILSTSVLFTGTNTLVQTSRMKENLQALQLARAGLALGYHRISGDPAYTGEGPVSLEKGAFIIEVTREGDKIILSATGYLPDAKKPRTSRTLKKIYTLSRSREVREGDRK